MIRRLTPRWRLRATVAAMVLPPLIHLVSLETLHRWIGRRRSSSPPDPSVDDPALSEWVDRVLAKLPPPWKKTCLRRAIVLHYLLRRAGRPAALMIGVRRDETNQLAAHAWLERGGVPYLEPGTDRVSDYRVLTAFPAWAERP